MKRFICQVVFLGAYDDWKKLPLKDKIILPLSYIGMLTGYYILSMCLHG